MAITTYAGLKTAIATWLARDDLTDNIPDFIALFEATAARRLRVRLQKKTITIYPDAGEATLPTDFAGSVRMVFKGAPDSVLDYVSAPQLDLQYPDSVSGIPAIYTIEGTTIRIRPATDDELEFTYYQKTPALATKLNWLFQNHPDLYLFGSLVEAEVFNKDAERAAVWKGRRDELFEEIIKQDFNERPAMAVYHTGATP